MKHSKWNLFLKLTLLMLYSLHLSFGFQYSESDLNVRETEHAVETLTKIFRAKDFCLVNIKIYADFDAGSLLEPILNQKADEKLLTFINYATFKPFVPEIEENFLLVTPRHFYQRSPQASFHFLILNGKNPSSVLESISQVSTSQPTIDKILIYQWTYFQDGLLHANQLRKFKYKTELIQNGANTSFDLYCIYCNLGNPKILRQTTNQVIGIEQIFPDFTTNFHGKTLRFSTSKGNPILTSLYKTKNGSWEYSGGVFGPVLDGMKQFFNCTLTTYPDVSYGGLRPDGTYSGVVGRLYAKEIDIGGMAQHYDRHFVASFSHLLTQGNVVVSTRLPLKTATFNAFTLDAFLFLLGICVGVVLPFYVLALRISNRGSSSFSYKSGISKGIKFVYVPLYEQELSKKDLPKASPLQILLVFWLFFCLIITTAYKSKLLDLMLQGSQEVLPTTFDELAASAHYEVNARGYGGALKATLKAIRTPTFQNVVKRMKTIEDTIKCIDRALQKRYAVCICYKEVLDLITCRNYTDRNGKKLLRISPESKNAFFLYACMATRRDAVYKDSIDRLTHKAYAAYLPQYSLVKDFRQATLKGQLWARSRQDASYGDESVRKALELKHFRQIFILLFVCLSIATIAFLVEIRARVLKFLAISG